MGKNGPGTKKQPAPEGGLSLVFNKLSTMWETHLFRFRFCCRSLSLRAFFLGLFGFLLRVRLQAQTVVFWLDGNDLEIVALSDLDILDLILIELRDVSQSVDILVQLGEDTERVDLGDLTEDLLSNLVLLVHILPGIAFQGFYREGNARIIDTDDLAFDLLAYIEQLRRVIDELPGEF